MTTPDTEALRRVAEAAVKSYRDDAPDKAAAIDFDVTFDPPTVLTLLDERDAAANRISELEARVAQSEAERDAALSQYRHWAGIANDRLGSSNKLLVRAREAEARVGVLEGAMSKIADGKVLPEQHGHYLAHREAVEIARAALTHQEKDQGR